MILYMGGEKAGLICLLALRAAYYNIHTVITTDPPIEEVCERFNIRTIKSYKEYDDFHPRLLVSVHGREIIPQDFLDRCTHGGINLHPCLKEYPGANPIKRALADHTHHWSVSAHRMTDVVDGGPVIAECHLYNWSFKSEAEVYNALYPLYVDVVLRAVGKIFA